MQILVTGSAGFIGFHLSQALLKKGIEVLGIDNLNNYYDVDLKEARLKLLKQSKNFKFIKMDIADRALVAELFREHEFSVVVNLAAQAGVRYSLQNPLAYIDSNLVGFANILEGCRRSRVKHVVFASSSSVYGANTLQPFSEQHPTNHPIALYGATKKGNELIAHSYASLYNLPITGLRFFTVYGPWGRPDMAYYIFTRAILEDEPINIFNQGNSFRDFTYIDDVVNAITKVINKPPSANKNWDSNNPDPASSYAPYRIYNVGNSNPIELNSFIDQLENVLGKTAVKNYLPPQPGDVLATSADISSLCRDFDCKPKVALKEGLKHFARWYSQYYQIKLPLTQRVETLAEL
jgi:UDP-glucuronate 4-epimerase